MQVFDALHADALSAVQRPTNSSMEQNWEKAESAKFNETLKEAQKSLAAKKGQGALSPEAEALVDKKLQEACRGFEAMFLDIMYRQMRQTVPKDGLFGHDNTDDILESMRDTAMMNSAAEAGGIGLAKTLYEQLKREQNSIPAK